jgi:hypothetical protein
MCTYLHFEQHAQDFNSLVDICGREALDAERHAPNGPVRGVRRPQTLELRPPEVVLVRRAAGQRGM